MPGLLSTNSGAWRPSSATPPPTRRSPKVARRNLAPGKQPLNLAELPRLNRRLLMEHFDELVCDPRLHRYELLDWVGEMTRDQLYLDRYRVLLTSGSSGRRGLFVYDACGWRSIVAGFVRTANRATCGRPCPGNGWPGSPALGRLTSPAREPPPWRSACTGSCPCRSPCHFRAGRGTQPAPPHLPERLPLDRYVAGQQGRPPAHLATDICHRREAAHPRDDRATGQRVRGATFDLYGCTEGLLGSECEYHQGIHLFEDTTLVENVDAGSQPVPAGQLGARLLVTNLDNLVQPLIRVE